MHSTGDRATILWRLRARHTETTCVLDRLPVGALLTLQQDDQVVLQDTFPDVHLAVARANALRARLQAKGWRAVPLENSGRGRRRA